MGRKKERWRYIKGMNKMYQISSLSRVKTFQPRYKTTRILKPGLAGNGYFTVNLTDPQGNKKSHCIHRLVIEAFVPNPENKKYTNHKDGDKKNNSIENLEWVTPGENNSHAIRIGLKKSIHPARGIIKMDLNGKEIARYRTSEDVPGFKSGNICRATKRPDYTSGGFKWKYVN